MITGFLRKRCSAFCVAIQGLGYMVRNEPHARIHLTAIILVVIAGVLTGIDRVEWALLVLAIGLVLALEAVNSALEALADAAHPERHPLVGAAKDMAAGAVLVSAVCSVIIAGLVFLPHWCR